MAPSCPPCSLPPVVSPAFSLDSLCPEDLRLALGVRRFMERGLGVRVRGGRFLIALSGGSDSVALLLLFAALRSAGAWLAAAHLDHALRPESAAEASAAGRLCASLGIGFTCRREPVGELAARWGCGTEEAGRRVRYAFLEESRVRAGADWVLTAHHLGDLAEDVVMRLVRGAAWPGLGGMRGRVDEPGRRLLRPLLMQEKSRLRLVPEHLGVPWSEDSSNAVGECRRNRIRLDVLPMLLRENPSFPDAVRRLWRCARRDEESLQKLYGLLDVRDGAVVIPAGALCGLDRASFCRLAAEAVRRLGRGQPGADVLESAADAWERRRFPRRFSLPGGVKAEMDASGIVFRVVAGR